MSETAGRSVALGDIDATGSRQLGRRSAVCWAGGIVVGREDGTIIAHDGATLEERWRNPGPTGSVVSMAALDSGVIAGARGPDGELRYLDAESGEVHWRYSTADDVGDPQKQTRFFLPFVVDIVTQGEQAFIIARRYERDPDDGRSFHGVVYAFDSAGGCQWRHETDASPIAIDVNGDRVAVAFNRCPGDDSDGVRVLDTADGSLERRWDPPGDGDRRAGDVSLLEGGLAVASHANYRGYLLDDEGSRWSVALGCPTERGDETVYAYPNHVHATSAGVIFITGNTYPEAGRETEARHPCEHTAVGVTTDGEKRWRSDVGGFVHNIATDGERVAVPVAQHFRERDPSVHGILVLDVADGAVGHECATGVVTAAAIDSQVAAIEEPVSYHDEAAVRGQYRLHVAGTGNSSILG